MEQYIYSDDGQRIFLTPEEIAEEDKIIAAGLALNRLVATFATEQSTKIAGLRAQLEALHDRIRERATAATGEQ